MTRTFWMPFAALIVVHLIGALPAHAQSSGQSNGTTRVSRSGYAAAADSGVVRASDGDQFGPRMTAQAATARVYAEPTPTNPIPPVPSAIAEPAPAADAAAPACSSCNQGCSTCGDCYRPYSCCSCELTCPDACPMCYLFDDCCCLKEHCTTLRGYFEGGYSVNGWGNDATWNGPVGFNDRNDEFQLNQLFVSLEKVTKGGDCCWDVGGRIDMVYGTDARWLESAGLEKTSGGAEKWSSGDELYHLALVQAYAELAYGDWKTKIGKWITPFEYEVIDSRSNPFYSHSYGFLYGGNYTNTGVIATKTVNDNLNWGVGVSSGVDNTLDNDGRAAFVGTINWTSLDKNTNLIFALITGDERNVYAVETNQTILSTVWTQKINPRLTNVFVNDIGVQADGADNGTSNATWYALEDYLLYQLSCNWWLNGRFEWFQDTDGTRVAPVGDSLTTNSLPGSNPATAGGFAGNFYEYTIGLNYKPLSNPNLIVRPELRWDNYNGVGHPFNNNTENSQFMFAVDAIYNW